jgi:hypothetical protein
MNLCATTRLGAAALCLGLFAASPADAATGNTLLYGEDSATSTGSCLTAPSGFNDKLQPNMPEVSTVATDTGEEVWIFNGAGSVAVTSTGIRTSSVASSPSNPNTASASGTTTRSTRKYTVGPEHTVTVTATNVMGENFAGPLAGQTLVIDKYVLQGHASRDGETVTLATPEPVVERITLSDGLSLPRICHRAVVLLKQ